MPDISAILKNKGISLADTNESKILSSLNGLFQRPVEPVHFSKLVSNKNQFYREKELEELAEYYPFAGRYCTEPAGTKNRR